MFNVGYYEKRESLRMMRTELAALREAHGCVHLDGLIATADELLELGVNLWDLDEKYDIVWDEEKREKFEDGFNWAVNSYLHFIKDPAAFADPVDPDYE